MNYWIALNTPNGAPANPITVHRALPECGVHTVTNTVRFPFVHHKLIVFTNVRFFKKREQQLYCILKSLFLWHLSQSFVIQTFKVKQPFISVFKGFCFPHKLVIIRVLQGILLGLFICSSLFKYNCIPAGFKICLAPPQSKLLLTVRRIVNILSFLRLVFAAYIKVNFSQHSE